MYKVMLLDDEPWELKGLKNMLPWKEHGFEVICELSNPLQALEILQKETFDVLVSDIRMPGLDGISLMKKIRTFDPDLEIIFVSGYAEFEYAREALRAGAYDYLLKPVDLDLSDPLLDQLGTRLDEKQQTKILKLMDQITGGKLSFQDLFPNMGTDVTCHAVMGGTFLAACFEKAESLFSFCMPCGPNCILNFIAHKKEFQPDIFLQESFPDQMIGLSLPLYGDGLMQPDSLNRLMKQAFAAYHSSFFLSPPCLYSYHETDQNGLRSITEHVHTLYTDGKTDELLSYLQSLPQTLRSIPVNITGMVRLWNQLILLILTDSDLYEESCLLSSEHMLENYSDIRQMCRKLAFLHENNTSAQTEHSTTEGRDIYSTMIGYVNQHFKESITLQDVADCVHINFTYASKLFKKYTDTNYSKYLTGLRMELACRLLTNTDKTTQEICYEIGYNDYFYFNKSFKKHTGQTPLQYRRK